MADRTDEQATDEQATDEQATDEQAADEQATDEQATNEERGDGVTVAENAAEQRWEIFVDGERVGLAEYLTDGETIVFTHTEVDPPDGRKGLGGRLVATALDDARRRGLVVVPRCPFVAAYITKHPEYLDLVGPADRARLSA